MQQPPNISHKSRDVLRDMLAAEMKGGERGRKGGRGREGKEGERERGQGREGRGKKGEQTNGERRQEHISSRER